MNREYSILLNIAERLGIQDDATVKKTKEFLRVFQSKGSVKTLNESAKLVLCLDLASAYLGTNFDKETAIKLSGLTKSVYQNNLHTVEKVLELDKQLIISELCIQLGCTVIKDLAEEILEKYKTNHSLTKDLRHPQYIAAAVYMACRLKKIKIQKQQFLAVSHLKSSQWKELIVEFEKFVTSLGLGSPGKKSKKDNLNSVIGDIAKDIEEKVVLKKQGEEEIEDYEVWKKRILDEAYEALKSEEKMQE